MVTQSQGRGGLINARINMMAAISTAFQSNTVFQALVPFRVY